MHETIFAKRIIEEAKKHDVHGDVKSITVELGELGHVPPEELAECLKQIAPWTVHHVVKEAKIECVCGFKGRPTILERGHDISLLNVQNVKRKCLKSLKEQILSC